MSTEISTNTTPARGLALQSFDDAYRFSKMVAASEFAPKDFRGKPESCMLAIQHGSEVGLSPMQSLQSIAVINGRPTIWGDAALALVQASAVCEFVYETVEGDGEKMEAVCQAKRRGYAKPTTVTFTVADAKKAGLWGKAGPWTQYPKRMLQLRARGFALRDAFPDVLRGLVTAEEARDYHDTETPAAVAEVPQPARAPDRAQPLALTDDPVAKARLAVSRCTDIDAADRLRALVGKRLTEGTFTQAQHDEIVQLLHHKVEMLIGDRGQEFTHEAAEHEVTA